jgi:hypothetical protein
VTKIGYFGRRILRVADADSGYRGWRMLQRSLSQVVMEKPEKRVFFRLKIGLLLADGWFLWSFVSISDSILTFLFSVFFVV